jgi:hypothetical protein
MGEETIGRHLGQYEALQGKAGQEWKQRNKERKKMQ